MKETKERKLTLVENKDEPTCGGECPGCDSSIPIIETETPARVIQMSEFASDGRMWTPEGMVGFALEEHEKEPAEKAFLIFLNDADETYFPRWYNCKLRLSEAIALLETVKADLVHMLLYGGE
jgi:hypothetical protein